MQELENPKKEQKKYTKKELNEIINKLWED
jgi:hypothetical protein